VYRGVSAGDLAICPVQPVGTATSISDTSAVPGVLYLYAVTAKTAAGESAKSNTAYGMVKSTSGMPTVTKSGNDSDGGYDPNSTVAGNTEPLLAPMGVARYLSAVSVMPDGNVVCGTAPLPDTKVQSGDGSAANPESGDGEFTDGDSFIDVNGDGLPDLCQLRNGDLDLDGSVGQSDLAVLLTMLGEEPMYGIGDLDQDGMITIGDVQRLAAIIDAAELSH
jgi:hypothetical protein